MAALCRDVVAAHPELAGLSVEAPEGPVVAQAIAGAAVGRPPSIRLRCTLAPTGVELAVIVNGPGVPESARERIFEPYVTGRADGTGLGLVIVKRITLDHEGTVEVAAPPEGGSVFRLFLPAPGSATMADTGDEARDSEAMGGVTASQGHVTGQLDAERVAGRAVGREHRRS